MYLAKAVKAHGRMSKKGNDMMVIHYRIEEGEHKGQIIQQYVMMKHPSILKNVLDKLGGFRTRNKAVEHINNNKPVLPISITYQKDYMLIKILDDISKELIMEDDIRKKLIISNKQTGFTQFADGLEMSVLLDKPAILEVGKHHELTWSIGSGERDMYIVDVGKIDEDTNELLSVKLMRKSKEVQGEITLSVVLIFHDCSLQEIAERQKKEEDEAKRGAALFLDDSQTPKKSIKDLADEVNDLQIRTLRGFS